MEKIKLYHTGGYKMSKDQALKMIDNKKKPIYSKIKNAKSDKMIILQGNTQITGYMLVIQALTKTFKDLEVIAIAKNMSVYGY